MEKNEFKKIISEVLKQFNFRKIKKVWIKDFEDFYLKVELQSSNFCNGYYINYFVALKELHLFDEILKFGNDDFFGRICFSSNGELQALIELEELEDVECFTESLIAEIKKLNSIFELGGVKHYFEIYPEMKSTIYLNAKEYMIKKGYITELE